jgi:hypothetical protein
MRKPIVGKATAKCTGNGHVEMRSKKVEGVALYICESGQERRPRSTIHVIRGPSTAEAGRRSWKVSAWAEGVAGGRTALIRGSDWTLVSFWTITDQE